MIIRFFAAIILLLAIVTLWGWSAYQNALTFPVVTETSIQIEIKKGDSFKQISDRLIAHNVSINPLWFKIIAYQNKISNKLKAGDYELQTGMTMPDILNLFVVGKSRQYSITFPEGWNFKQIIQQIKNDPYLVKTLDGENLEALMSKLGSNYTHPEGLLFPDTYFFEKNTTDFALLKIAYDKMQRVLTQEWENRDKNLPLDNEYQALILASIVEKETGVAEERAEISGVFTRRLKKGMLLQTDPTVIYGMGDDYQGNIRYKDLKKATPYNTYVIKGLPPTPIAMPGRAAIHAALHPAAGKSLYFVAKGGGRHFFSASLREHNNAVNKYQRKR